MSENKQIQYGYFDFLLKLNEEEMYNLATEIENLCYDGYYIQMFNTARRFLECTLYGACDYLRIEPYYKEKTDQISIGSTTYACFKETNALRYYHEKIKSNITTLQEYSHYDDTITNENISDRSIEELFVFLRDLCIWYVKDVIKANISLPKYSIAKNDQVKSDLFQMNIAPYKKEISDLKEEKDSLKKEKDEYKNKYELLLKSNNSQRNSNNEAQQYYEDIIKNYKIKCSEYEQIGTVSEIKNSLGKIANLEYISTEIRKKYSEVLKENDILKRKLDYINNANSKTQEEKVKVLPKSTDKDDNDVLSNVKNTVLLFGSIGCYITLKTVFKYLIGRKEAYTARFKLDETDGYGKYNPEDLSLFVVAKALTQLQEKNVITTKDDKFYDVVKE